MSARQTILGLRTSPIESLVQRFGIIDAGSVQVSLKLLQVIDSSGCSQADSRGSATMALLPKEAS